MFGGAQIREEVRVNHQGLAGSTAGMPLITFNLLRRLNMSKNNGVREELKWIYRQAWCEGYWIQEFGADNGYLAAAGSIKQLEEIEKETGQEINVGELTLADVVNISMPGSGLTREEACLDALREYKKYEHKYGKDYSPKSG